MFAKFSIGKYAEAPPLLSFTENSTRKKFKAIVAEGVSIEGDKINSGSKMH